MSDNSSFMLKHNPLGIHSLDGTDLVLSKTPRQAPTPVDFDEHAVMSKAMNASYSYDANDDANDSVPTSAIDLTDLSIAQPLPSSDEQQSFSQSQEPRQDTQTPDSESFHETTASPQESSPQLGLPLDFGGAFKVGNLGRQNTITVRRMPQSESTKDMPAVNTRSGPSANPLLIHRLRSIRKRLDPADVPYDEEEEEELDGGGLSNDILKMIAFSADSPTIGFDESLSDLEEDEPEAEVQREPSSHNLLYSGKNPEEYNPFYAAVHRQPVDEASISASTLASHVSPDVSTQSPGMDYANASTPFDEPAVPPAPQPAPRTPLIEETDPVKEDDRGRLFLQINRIANMRGLPIDPGRHPKFTLSLDNGMQSVATDPQPLPSPGMNGQLTAKINQEFELIVAKDLELVLTVGVSMDAAQPPPKATHPHRRSRHQPKTSTAGSVESATSVGGSPIKSMKNLLMRSPKKKQQRFQQQQQEQEREEERRLQALDAEEERKEQQQYERDLKEFYTRTDLWKGITGSRGEYCRGYVFESHYEKDIYGRAKTYGIPLYNEWDKASQAVPKPVGELQVTMMYVPKLFASETIPSSMRECQEAVEAAKKKVTRGCEGFLTQQGGDCGNMWRRRWVVLNGVELIAHHEATRKRRSAIHLDKAIAVRDTLSDDLWCIYEDRSFQISFKDGEDISFYADTVEARDHWVKALKETIATSTGQHRSWTDLVLDGPSR